MQHTNRAGCYAEALSDCTRQGHDGEACVYALILQTSGAHVSFLQ